MIEETIQKCAIWKKIFAFHTGDFTLRELNGSLYITARCEVTKITNDRGDTAILFYSANS